MKLFISGSKSITELPITFKLLLDDYMVESTEFLVGDCYGVDAAAQKYLASKGYSNVTIYCSGEAPRNNFVSGAKIHSCAKAAKGLMGRAFHYVKDIQMANDCDQAIMIWDGKSKGTSENIRRIKEMKKTYIVTRYNFFDLIKNTTDSHTEYGFVFGSDRQKILLIKGGLGDSIYGNSLKYLKLACEIRDQYGFSVVCASTPSFETSPMKQFAEMVKSEFEITERTQILFMGVKNGATIGYYEQEYFPEISRLLLIDPSMMPTEPKICHGTKAFECGMITFVLRASMGKKLKSHESEKIHIVVKPKQSDLFSKDIVQLLKMDE